MNTSSIWPLRTSTTAAPRREARKPTASASASTKPSCRSSIRWRSANASTPASSSCRLTSIPGSPGTTNSDHIRGAGATAKRQCKPSLTPSHSPGRNHWPHDVGQTQPFRHQTGQLSDQVSASTDEATRSARPRLALDPAGFELLLLQTDGAEFGIAAKSRAHNFRFAFDHDEFPVLRPIAERRHAAHPHPLLLRGGDLVADPFS